MNIEEKEEFQRIYSEYIEQLLAIARRNPFLLSVKLPEEVATTEALK